MSVTLACIHTSHVLIPMFAELCKRELGGVEIFHMVDESLIRNTIRAQGLTKTTIRRVLSAVQSAHEAGADAVMVTCSSIGAAASIASRLFDFPVVRVDESMAEEAVRSGGRIGVAATLRTTLEPTVALLREKGIAMHREIDVVESLCEGAFDAVLSGDTEAHDRLLAESLASLTKVVDVVVLAQASMARVVDSLPASSLRIPILSSPEFAVRSARSLLFPEGSGSLN